MTLLTDLEEFVQEHRPHGGMTGDATQPAWNGYLLTVAVRRGVERWVAPPRKSRNPRLKWLLTQNLAPRRDYSLSMCSRRCR
jgi:hypothetical protein